MILEVLFLVGLCACGVHSHGRLIEPPSRSSMWRFPDDPAIKPYMSLVEPNFNDNELFCGGFQHQVNQGGKCGICGDGWDLDRENEAGGKYAKGIIVRQYEEGSVMDIMVELTAHHLGFFEFRLCEWNKPTMAANHECLNKNLLELVDGGTQYQAKKVGGSPWIYHVQVRLPVGLTCTQCILQWRYHAGNTWNCDEAGECCTGCGPQEEFYGCADVAIGSGPTLAPPNWSQPPTTTTGESAEVTTTTPTPSTTTTERITTTTTTVSAPPGSGPTCQAGMAGTFKLDCDTYYTCSITDGPFVYDCPPGTVYDENRKICDYAWNVPPECGTKTVG